MKIWKASILFYLGGTIYMAVEFLWRGWSHGSMFVLGGLCFLLLGQLQMHFPRLPLAIKVMLGAALVTTLELLTGLLVNQSFTVWDYRHLPYQFRGQICLIFSLLWMPLSLAGMQIYDQASRKLFPNPQ